MDKETCTWQLRSDLRGCKEAEEDFWRRSGLDMSTGRSATRLTASIIMHRCVHCNRLTSSSALRMSRLTCLGRRVAAAAEAAVEGGFSRGELRRSSGACRRAPRRRAAVEREGNPLKFVYSFSYLGYSHTVTVLVMLTSCH